MLTLTLQTSEVIQIGDALVQVLPKEKGSGQKIGIEAPAHIAINRIRVADTNYKAEQIPAKERIRIAQELIKEGRRYV